MVTFFHYSLTEKSLTARVSLVISASCSMFGCSVDSRSPMPASKDLTRQRGSKLDGTKGKLPKLFMLQPISRIAMKSPDSNWSKMGTGHGQEFSSFSGFSPRTFLPAIDPSSLFREFPPSIFAFPHENSCEEFLAFLITLFRNWVGRNQQNASGFTYLFVPARKWQKISN